MTTPETVFREFHKHLSLYVAKRLRQSDDAQDVLQEVYLRVVRNNETLAQTKKPLAWLYTITRSVLIDHYRKSARAQQNAKTPSIELEMLNEEIEYSPEFEKCLSPLIANLSPKYRDAIVFSQRDEGTQSDFARQQKINLSAAKSRIQRGRKLLKQAVLGCCQVEFDSNNRVMSLQPGDDCSGKCC